MLLSRNVKKLCSGDRVWVFNRNMKLLAISDLHLKYEKNQEFLKGITDHKDDWLILAGDLGEGVAELKFAFENLKSKFKRLIWVPGNHELWTMPDDPAGLRGEHKYQELVSFCREHDVITPEDEYVKVKFGTKEYFIVPIFLLYDYSFRPDDVAIDEVIQWAAEGEIVSVDESYLHSDPYPSKSAWCQYLFQKTLERLESISRDVPIILVNHYPLRRDLVRLYKVPRYSPWCGTRLTEEWHTRFNIEVVVSGHLHMRATDWRDGVRFEEVSVGYPRQRNQNLLPDSFLREILPALGAEPPGTGVYRWSY